MATKEQVQAAIQTLLDRLDDVDPQARKKRLPDRTIGVHLLDLDITYIGELTHGEIVNVHADSGGVKPQIRLVCKSDDLLAMTDGDLSFAHAWATGQIRLDASLRDLLRLRNLA